MTERMRKLAYFLFFSLIFLNGSARQVKASFQEDFPNSSKYIFTQSESNLFFGAGLAPVSVVSQKPDISLSIFQVHWITGLFDLELINAMVGFTYLSDSNSYALNHFTFRSVPQIRITQHISIGPLVGFEFVSFPSVGARVTKGGFVTPEQPFSSGGLIYGGTLSELFQIGTQYKLKINQTVYKQTYSTVTSSSGWNYLYTKSELNADQAPIAPGMVFQLEFSFLY